MYFIRHIAYFYRNSFAIKFIIYKMTVCMVDTNCVQCGANCASAPVAHFRNRRCSGTDANSPKHTGATARNASGHRQRRSVTVVVPELSGAAISVNNDVTVRMQCYKYDSLAITYIMPALDFLYIFTPFLQLI